MPHTAEITYIPTCATCPFARQIDGNKYTCTAEHNHHNSVVRGHWQATRDCEEAIAKHYGDSTEDSWLTEPIGGNAVFHEAPAVETAAKKPASVELVSISGWKEDRTNTAYKLSTWKVQGKTSTYTVTYDTRGYTTCNCLGHTYRHSCYHADAVKREWVEFQSWSTEKNSYDLVREKAVSA